MKKIILFSLFFSCTKDPSCEYKYNVKVPINMITSCHKDKENFRCVYRTIGKQNTFFCKSISGNFNTTFHANDCIDQKEKISYSHIDLYDFETLNFQIRRECFYPSSRL